MITIKWVITNKGTEEEVPIAKARLVAREFNTGDKRGELFAGTPGLMAMRAVIQAMTKHVNGTRRATKLADVKTAFLYGEARRSLYVELPPEDPLAASGQYVGKLERAMYGTLDAPMIRQDHLRKTLLNRKFKESVTHPGCFSMKHETFSCPCMCTGLREDLIWLKRQLLKEYELKTKLMGEDDDMEKKAVYHGRTLEWSETGLGVRPDRRHVRALQRELAMDNCRSISTSLSATAEREGDRSERPEASAELATKHRAAVARVVYLAQDRLDLGVAAV